MFGFGLWSHRENIAIKKAMEKKNENESQSNIDNTK